MRDSEEVVRGLDSLLAAARVADEAAAALEEATGRANLIRELVKRDMLGVGGNALLNMEMDMHLLHSTAELAKSSLARARETFEKISDLEAERRASGRLAGTERVAEIAHEQIENELGLLRLRVEEARAFAVETMKLAETLRIPKLRLG